jgi:hypothetical protein
MHCLHTHTIKIETSTNVLPTNKLQCIVLIQELKQTGGGRKREQTSWGFSGRAG